MKIGLVCPYTIERSGGVLEVILALEEEFKRSGHEVRIITPSPRNPVEEKPRPGIIYAGVSVDFRTLSFSDTTAQVSSTADNERIDAMLAEEKFDVLNFHEPWMPLLSRQLLGRSNVVNIGTFHSKVTEAMLSRAILKVVNPYLKSVLKYLDVLTAVSSSGASYVAGMTDDPITFIPNGIDLHKYHPMRRTETDHKTILYIGRLERRKGTKYLLQAYSLLAQEHDDIELIIASDGPDREKLELLTEDLKLPNVSFLGFISDSLKQKLLREADLFCSPALFGESFGIVLLEAMASGCVTIAGNNPGYSDLMADLGAISIVNPEDTPEFARRMEVMLYQDDLRKLWKKWAKTYVKQFDYGLVANQYLEVYEDAIKEFNGKKQISS